MQSHPPSSPGWGQPEPDPFNMNVQQQFSSQQPYNPPQQPGQFYQQQTQYPSFAPQQQPIYPTPGQQWQQLPMMPMPPQKAPKKPMNKKLGIGCGAATALLVLIIVIAIAAGTGNQSSPSSSSSTTPAAHTTSASDQSTPTSHATSQSTSQPTSVPTSPPTPTLSPAQQEAAYKASTTDTSVPTLDKDGNADSGEDVHFTATILNFVKDDSGNTAGANVDDPNGGSGVVQIAFPIGTDISQLNAGDVVEVWGNDQGTATGQNAFGATIQEVVISALYLTDQTTGYQTN